MAHHHRRSHLAHRQGAAPARQEEERDHHQHRNADVATVVSVVYVSMPNTFTGDVVWVTQGDDPQTMVGAPAQTSQDDSEPTSTEVKTSAAKVTPVSSKKATSVAPSSAKTTLKTDVSSIVAPSTFSSVPATQLQVASSSPSVPVTAALATATASATAVASSSSSSKSSGMSGGAKAGLAFGILIGIAAILALVLVLYQKKKKSVQQQKLDDEKAAMQEASAGAGVAPSIRTARTMSTAPRLSLRPVTQFSPTLTENRKSAGSPLEMGAAPAANPRNLMYPSRPSPSAWERRGAANAASGNDNPFSDPTDPFGNHAALNDAPAPNTSQSVSPPRNLSNDFANPAPAIAAAEAASAVPVALATPVMRKEVPRSTPKATSLKSEEIPLPPQPSPTWTEDIPASPGPAPTGPPPIAVAGGNANGPAPMPNNVHRVQMDFKPSMNDELGLRAGQLVRMLHEYDDGWALCIRLDRSQQGVVPRTCLSKHPVKPRTGPPRQGPPPGSSGMRGPPVGPGIPQPRPLTPTGRNSPQPFGQSRPMSPAGGRNSPAPYGQPASMSPAGNPRARGRSNSNAPYAGPPRSMSPGPYGGGPQPPKIPRPRSNSASSVMARRASPPGPSPMNPNAGSVGIPARKPVPGQAM